MKAIDIHGLIVAPHYTTDFEIDQSTYMNIPDIAITKAIQELFSDYTPTMQFLSAVGDPAFYIILIIIIAWFFDYKTGIRLGLLISFAGLMQGVLKLVFQQPRPYEVSQAIPLKAGRAEMGYGLPSGHASVSATLSTYFTIYF
jgi:membrane-associated phospholipid phosphatase